MERRKGRWYTLGTANPETIILFVPVIGMLLVTLISVGGFTVLAQRRLRSLGMLSSIGATESRFEPSSE